MQTQYAVIHCRNPKCYLKVWVPAEKLGKHGRCPKCGHPLQAPAYVPPDELYEGPAVFEENDEARQLVNGSV